METAPAVFGVLIVLGLLYLLIRGGIRTFQRNWILALLLILFLGPIWVIWALVENVLDRPVKEPIMVNIINQQK